MPGLSQAMARTDLNASNAENSRNPPVEEFPALNHTANVPPKGRRGAHGHDAPLQDPAHSRFAAAVKKPPVATPHAAAPAGSQPKDLGAVPTRRDGASSSSEVVQNKVTVVAPKPSPRIKLRPPTLLPTLATGDSVNNLYMA